MFVNITRFEHLEIATGTHVRTTIINNNYNATVSANNNNNARILRRVLET